MYAACACIVLAAFAVSDAQKPTAGTSVFLPIRLGVSFSTATAAPGKPDCSVVFCAWPECAPGYHPVTVDGNCCPSCERCPPRLLPCPLLVCDAVIQAEEPCGCPVCTLFTGGGVCSVLHAMMNREHNIMS